MKFTTFKALETFIRKSLVNIFLHTKRQWKLKTTEEFPTSLDDMGILQYSHMALAVKKIQHNSKINIFIQIFVSKREGGKRSSR